MAPESHAPCIWHMPPAFPAHAPASLAHTPCIPCTCPQHHWYMPPAPLVHTHLHLGHQTVGVTVETSWPQPPSSISKVTQ